MDLIEKLNDFLKEREACAKAEQEAHDRIIQIDRTTKKLRNLIRDAEEILNDKVGVTDMPHTSAETLQDISNNLS